MKAHDFPQAGASARAALQCRTNPPQRILVVEDEPDIRRLDTEALRESGYEIDTAENGFAALHRLNSDHYDLLIVEDEMSGVSGLELVKELRFEGVTVPVILVLGMPTTEPDRNPWPQIQAILLKPYTVSELFKTVSEVLRTGASGVHLQLASPSNWQGPVFNSWLATLEI